MKATAIYVYSRDNDTRIALFDDGRYRSCNYYGNGYDKTPLDPEIIEDLNSVGRFDDISDTEEGREILAALNACIARRAALAEIGREGGKRSTAKKRAAARNRKPREPSPLVGVAELRRRILAYVIADEAAHGRGALPARTRAAMLIEEALGYRRELAAKLAALPADADRDAAAREAVAAHRLARTVERWRWLVLKDPMQP